MLRSAVSSGQLAPGAYLFGGQSVAATRSFLELQFDLDLLLQRLRV
jgi:hypothetical protein